MSWIEVKKMSNSIFKTEEEEIDSQTGEEVTDQGEILEFSANVDEVAEEDTICDDDYSPTEEITDEAHAHDEDSQVNDSQFSHGPSHLMPIAPNTVIFKINVFQVEAYALGHTNARAEQESEQGSVSNLCFFVVFQLTFGKLGAVLHLIQQHRYFVCIKTYDFLFMKLGHRNENCRIISYELGLIEIIVKTP